MYALLAIDTVLRIGAAMLLLFVLVPALAWPRPKTLGRLEWFWWCFGAGIVLLTLAGQLFTLLNINGPLAYAALLLAIVVVCRARRCELGVLQYIASVYRGAIVVTLKLLDGKINLRRRFGVRRLRRRFSKAMAVPPRSIVVVAIVAAFVRFYRPFTTANLGFSDTYVHLYLMRLLDQGRQVDPAWGPYPRGMHFLLLAIQRLTNVDPILLMNFFGATAGVLAAIAVAYAAKRIARSNVAALVAGLVFATMIGGPHQYFLLGGSVSTDDPQLAHTTLAKPYDQLTDFGEFDVLLTAFSRQTSTLPQELAIVLLLPTVLFLLDWLRDGNRWRLAGFIAGTAAISAIHSGVVVPLVLLCAAAALVVILSEVKDPFAIRQGKDPSAISQAAPSPSSRLRMTGSAALAGAIGVAIGSTWMLGFLVYRGVSANSKPGSTALYYFPFLRPFAGGNSGMATRETAYMMFTPFLMAMLVIALLVAMHGRRNPHALLIALATAIFISTHVASTFGIPEIVEVRRNASWLAMTLAVLLGVAVAALRDLAPQRVARAVPAFALAAWAFTIPNLFGATIRSKLIDYSGYGATALAVVEISHQLRPFTWTLVSYGQEYPMVLGRGFHLNGVDFLERYDPGEAPLRIPTPYVFIAVEKQPHQFQINTWSSRFDRAAVEERLATWCSVYRLTHHDMRIWIDDPNVRVYRIVKPEQRIAESRP